MTFGSQNVHPQDPRSKEDSNGIEQPSQNNKKCNDCLGRKEGNENMSEKVIGTMRILDCNFDVGGDHGR